MGATGRAAIRRALILAPIVLGLGLSLHAQTHSSDLPSIPQLVAEERWEEALPRCQEPSHRSADEEHACGLAFAKAGRLTEAAQALLRGRRMSPKDPRFLIDLGGVAFKQKDYPEAARWMLRADRLSPGDAYVNDFLGTVFFLQGNLEASLKFWNRAGKPQIEQVRFEPKPRTDPVLLDRALGFAPGTVARREELLSTESRLRALDVFATSAIRLEARQDGKFDLSIYASERNGFGSSKWEALLSTFGGVFFQTITPAYYNIGGSGTNVTALWRWDAEKRRASGAISGPLRRSAKYRYRLGVDFRNENWSLTNFSEVSIPQLGDFNLRKAAGTAVIESAGARWSWRSKAEVSYRDFRSISPGLLVGSNVLLEGMSLAYSYKADYSLVRIPERHYFAAVSGGTKIGRIWAGDSPAYAKFQAGLRQQWSPIATGDDYNFLHSVQVGGTVGDVPFDEFFILGLERDNDLVMRAHIGTRDGRKGSAPIGSNYFVSNFDFDKKLWSNGLVTFKLGPFVDVGKIADPLAFLGTRKWLWDAGGQFKASVLGVGVGVTYGRDLRSGKDAVYAFVRKQVGK